jgi:SAM-dependent methyltransferase
MQKLMQSLKARLFLMSAGHYSNHRFYGAYKDGELRRALDSPFPSGQLPAGYGRWLDERLVEYPWMLSELQQESVCLLDAGSTLNHRLILNQPQLRGKKITIMTLAPEEECFWRQGVSYVYGDLRHTFFRDETFDCVVSLSVLEHVGLDNSRYVGSGVHSEPDPEAYLAAAAEFRRVLKPGGSCLISVPFGKRDVRTWLQVFDATMLDRLIAAFQPASHTVTYFRYTPKEEWQRSAQAEAADARYFDLSSDTPWPGCPAGAGAVACLHLKK